MKIKIWTVTSDTNNGLFTSTHTSYQIAKDTMTGNMWPDDLWEAEFGDKPRPDDPQDTQELLADVMGYIDSHVIEEHEIAVSETLFESWTSAELQRVRQRADELEVALSFTHPYIDEWIDMFDPSDNADSKVKAARQICIDGFVEISNLLGIEVKL